jgi:hypothetical protein
MTGLNRKKSLLRDPLAALLFLIFLSGAKADDAVALKETFVPGQRFHVQSHMAGTATLILPSEKDKKEPESLSKSASSSIDYDERVLENDADGMPNRVLRVYSRIDFRKEVGKEKLENTLRDRVRRLVLMREKGMKAPFSPDGPLLLSEIELVRTDVFMPLLSGLLPTNPVKPGDTWKASEAAIRELTDMQAESGTLECKLIEVKTLNGRSVAVISVNGTVKGVNEDGPVSHELSGPVYFDIDSKHISYASLRGKQLFLDKAGQTTGSIEGTLTITRQAGVSAPKLEDAAIRELKLTPDSDNTLLLYDNEDLGVRFLYPRRWHVANVDNQTRQIALDAENGNGILMTLLPLKDVPTPGQFDRENRQFIADQQGRILGTQKTQVVQSNPEVDYFGFEAELKGQRVELDYYIARQRTGGATVAARLVPENLQVLRPEVERIARSVFLTK